MIKETKAATKELVQAKNDASDCLQAFCVAHAACAAAIVIGAHPSGMLAAYITLLLGSVVCRTWVFDGITRSTVALAAIYSSLVNGRFNERIEILHASQTHSDWHAVQRAAIDALNNPAGISRSYGHLWTIVTLIAAGMTMYFIVTMH